MAGSVQIELSIEANSDTKVARTGMKRLAPDQTHQKSVPANE